MHTKTSFQRCLCVSRNSFAFEEFSQPVCSVFAGTVSIRCHCCLPPSTGKSCVEVIYHDIQVCVLHKSAYKLFCFFSFVRYICGFFFGKCFYLTFSCTEKTLQVNPANREFAAVSTMLSSHTFFILSLSPPFYFLKLLTTLVTTILFLCS